MYLLEDSDEIRTVQELPGYQLPDDVRLLYALGPVMLVLQLALTRGAGFPRAGRDLRVRMVEARSRFRLGRMPALRSPGGRRADRPQPLPLYGKSARGQGSARACNIGFSIFDPTAIVNP